MESRALNTREALGVLQDTRGTAARILDSYDGKQHSRQEHVFILLLARAAECVGAICHLLEGGYEQDATALGRTVADIYIDLLFIGTDRDQLLQQYYDFGLVAGKRRKEQIARVLGRDVDELWAHEYEAFRNELVEEINSAEGYRATVASEVERVTELWAYQPKGGWHPLSARRKAEKIDEHRALPTSPNEVRIVYELMYSEYSETLHAGISGVSRGLSISAGTATLKYGPGQPRAVSNFLLVRFLSHLYLKIFDNVNSELSLGCAADLRRLEQEHRKLWQQANE